MKILTLAAIAACLAFGSASAQAQSKATANPVSSSGSRAAVVLAPGAITNVNPVAGTVANAAIQTGGSLLGNPQTILSTAGAPSTGTFNECGIAFSGGLWLLTLSYTGESKSCVAQRQALLALQMGQGNMAFELMCDVDTWKAAAERSAAKGLPTPECQATQVARLANEAKQPRSVPVSPVAAMPTPPVSYGREICMDNSGREVPLGTRGASCGFSGS